MNEAVVAQLARTDMERIKGYHELLDFYNGRQWEGRERRGERRLIFNYARVFVEKITSYLMAGISFNIEPFEDSDKAKASARKAESAIYKVYGESQLEQLDLETEIDCAVLGDACYKVIWDADVQRVSGMGQPETQVFPSGVEETGKEKSRKSQFPLSAL